MSDYLEAETFLDYFGDDKPGMSKPICVVASDGNIYVLKNQNAYDTRLNKWVYWDSAFFNEELVYYIAAYLNIKIPKAAIINVDKMFIDSNPVLTFKHHFEPGLHFGSQFVRNSEETPKQGYLSLMNLRRPYIKRSWNAFFRNINNKDDIAKIIVLDFLTGNFDRFGNRGNLLVASPEEIRYVYAIDHGHCFCGPFWGITKQRFLSSIIQKPGDIATYEAKFEKYPNSISRLGLIFDAVEQHVNISDPQNHDFLDPVFLIENITKKMIDEWISNIPDEWFIDKPNQIDAHEFFLLHQKNEMRHLIDFLVNRNIFKTHGISKGGTLHWIEKRTGTL